MTDLDLKNIEDLLLNQKCKEVIIKIQCLLEKEPNNKILLEKCGDAYEGIKEYEEAMKYHSKAYELDKNNLILKHKLINDIHLKEVFDTENKNKRIKSDNPFDDYKKAFNSFISKKIF